MQIKSRKKLCAIVLAFLGFGLLSANAFAYAVYNQSYFKQIWVMDLQGNGMGWQEVGSGNYASCDPNSSGCYGNIQIFASEYQTVPNSSIATTEFVTCTTYRFNQGDTGHYFVITGGGPQGNMVCTKYG